MAKGKPKNKSIFSLRNEKTNTFLSEKAKKRENAKKHQTHQVVVFVANHSAQTKKEQPAKSQIRKTANGPTNKRFVLLVSFGKSHRQGKKGQHSGGRSKQPSGSKQKATQFVPHVFRHARKTLAANFRQASKKKVVFRANTPQKGFAKHNRQQQIFRAWFAHQQFFGKHPTGTQQPNSAFFVRRHKEQKQRKQKKRNNKKATCMSQTKSTSQAKFASKVAQKAASKFASQKKKTRQSSKKSQVRKTKTCSSFSRRTIATPQTAKKTNRPDTYSKKQPVSRLAFAYIGPGIGGKSVFGKKRCVFQAKRRGRKSKKKNKIK
jgi:hypothetical protein